MRRHLNDETFFVTDRDTAIVMVCKNRNLRTKIVPNDKHRAALHSNDITYFRRLFDDIVTADIQRKDATKRNKEKLRDIEAAKRRGIPVEQSIVKVGPNQTPVRVVRIMPLWKRCWIWVKNLFSPKAAIDVK